MKVAGSFEGDSKLYLGEKERSEIHKKVEKFRWPKNINRHFSDLDNLLLDDRV